VWLQGRIRGGSKHPYIRPFIEINVALNVHLFRVPCVFTPFGMPVWEIVLLSLLVFVCLVRSFVCLFVCLFVRLFDCLIVWLVGWVGVWVVGRVVAS
jgi:hypothetical protein